GVTVGPCVIGVAEGWAGIVPVTRCGIRYRRRRTARFAVSTVFAAAAATTTSRRGSSAAVSAELRIATPARAQQYHHLRIRTPFSHSKSRPKVTAPRRGRVGRSAPLSGRRDPVGTQRARPPEGRPRVRRETTRGRGVPGSPDPFLVQE